MKVTTAVIFASGFGSRMLPITAAVQKELLPILNRPVIDYTVSDCIKAGIKRIIFVVRPGTHALQDYYLGLPSLQHHLKQFGKQEALELLRSVHSGATFDFIEQPEDAGYGTAIPLKVVRPRIAPTDAIVACSGDDFLYHTDGTSEVAAMIKTFHASGGVGLISGLERSSEELHNYGVIKSHTKDGHEFLTGFVEKPAPGAAPSNLVNISKYIFSPTMLDFVDQVTPNPETGEYYVTDAVMACAAKHPVAVHRAGGRYLDSGNKAGWLEANLIVARRDPKLAAIIERIHGERG